MKGTAGHEDRTKQKNCFIPVKNVKLKVVNKRGYFQQILSKFSKTYSYNKNNQCNEPLEIKI